MPVHREGSGWQWGRHGKVYPTKEQAEKQGEAAHANGYQEKDVPWTHRKWSRRSENKG